MYYVSGSNIFGQWLSDKLYFNEFHSTNAMTSENDFFANKINIKQVNWSHNIIHLSNTFYAVGAWQEKDKQIVKLPLPTECVETVLQVVGNDYQLLFVAKDTIWVMNINGNYEFKKLKITEESLDNCNKKAKLDITIAKVRLINEACLYLTTDGCVFSGILPSLIDTSHCLGKVCDIQCGYEHYVLLTDLGRVYTWGNGRRLQLGHGDVSNFELPTEVDALAGIRITKIATGGWHTLALSESGDVYAWGWNDTGQLGIKERKHEGDLNKKQIEDQSSKIVKSYSVPTLVDLIDESGNEVNYNVIDIACGSKHSAILLGDGSVWTSGCNKYGQLGFSNEEYPVLVYFKKAFHVNSEASLICGPWTTVLNVENKQ